MNVIKTKQKRSAISLETKATILKRLEDGEGSTALGNEFGLSESTIRGIKKMAGKINISSHCANNESAKRASYSRNILIEKTEKALKLWIQESTEKQIPIGGKLIKEKAMEIFNLLKDLEPSCSSTPTGHPKFTASNGWLDGFLQRNALRKKRNKITSADETAIEDNISSQMMPLENSPWPVGYPNFPDQHHSSDPHPNIHFPEVKLEVGTFDVEDRNKEVYDPTAKHNNSDFSYIVPNSVCDVATDEQSAVSSKRDSAEANGAKPKQNQSTAEPEVVEVTDLEVKSSDHPIETFFKSMAATVMTFPPHLMAVAKLNVCKLITELELRALSEKNRFEANQERINEMLTENIVEMSSTSSK